MKPAKLGNKLILKRETIQTLTPDALEGVQGGLTPAIVSFVITMLSCGFFCNPQKAR